MVASRNDHFLAPATWDEARSHLAFEPLQPKHTAGCDLQSLAIHIRDYKLRELAIGDRSLEAHYDTFVLTETRKADAAEARRAALEVSYGAQPIEALIAGREGRLYEHGPEPEPDDPDGRMPAVVVWSDGPMLYLVASGELPTDVLTRIAASLH